ncbi:ABC transporter substrate-binding protein [Vibrio sp. SS-MA-C1-2]|uniref:ABC transporter substrate-binding protein n=1 Tax=Vibrio sp. SS-MA-C1-2 TaxID=2908646 RepID=UPI001F3777B3|nr:ABC transporter substrate-binding protein [Vibrio sp. SS-MA-C1-2]UJF17891.1 ABC transporter substrate-binding protein [Vibrio sp. SS-MA-C1-2]
MKRKTLKTAALFSSLFSLNLISYSIIAAEVPEGTELAQQQVLVRGNGMEIVSIDPHKVEGTPESNVIRDLLEGLVNQDSKGDMVSAVAESWMNQNNSTFTFKLRKEAKWSNGDPVTADDFIYSFQRGVDPKTASPYAWYFEKANIVNASDIVKGLKGKDQLGIKALNPYTLEIKLNKPTPYFIKMLAHTAMKPVHQQTIQQFGDKWTSPKHFVGNGAFVLADWVLNEKIDLVRNPNYWDNQHTVLNSVTFLPIDNQVSEMNRFLSGEISITNDIPLANYQHLKNKYPDNVVTKGNLCSYYYEFNSQKAPFDNVNVRKALSYAIDRDVIANKIMGQGQKPAYTFTPEIVNGFNTTNEDYAQLTQAERVEKAKKLLEQAGFNEENPLSFSLLYNTSDNHKKIAIAVQSMWKNSLGAEVQLENKEWKSYVESRKSGDFDVTRAGWCGDYNEASSFLSVLQSNNSANTGQYFNAKFEDLLDQATKIQDLNQRGEYYTAAEKILTQDMPVAPIYQQVSTRLISKQLKGYPINNADDRIYSKDLYIIK